MACFLVPATEAVITTIAQKLTKKEDVKENLRYLNGFLWGGSAMLAFEHLWHGEISPFFPFLTATKNPVEFTEMLHEMGTSGIAMAVAVTSLWAIGCKISAKKRIGGVTK